MAARYCSGIDISPISAGRPAKSSANGVTLSRWRPDDMSRHLDRSDRIVQDAAMHNRWLTVAETIQRYRISRDTLYRWLAEGLPSHQPGGERCRRWFDPDEVDEFIRSRCFAKSGVS